MSEAQDAAASWLAGKLLQMEEALASLVNVNSFTDNREGGNRVGALLEQLFKMPGLSAASVPSKKFADHWVFSSTGKAEASPLLLIGHLDTVFPPGKFEGYRVDGALRRGPGVLDMKGGLVVIAFALHALEKTLGLNQLPPLRVIVVSDEEVGSPEGQGIIRQHAPGASAALVFESGRAQDAIITRRKGTGQVVATAHGKAAHAGNAHKEGVNALWALARFVDRVQLLTNYEKGLTVNVGKIEGGQGKNTVPDRAEAHVDLRFETRADGEALVESFRQAASASAASVPGSRVEISGGISRGPLERSPANVALMARYAESAQAFGLGSGESPLVGGASDACTTAAFGIASIDGLGPRGKGFHTVEECIEVDSLIPKAQALARFIAGG